MDTKLRKVRQAQRDARAKKLGTPDPFTTPTPKKPIRPFGDKPVAGGLPMDPTRTYTTTKGGRKITKVFDFCMLPVIFLNAWDINLACRPTW